MQKQSHADSAFFSEAFIFVCTQRDRYVVDFLRSNHYRVSLLGEDFTGHTIFSMEWRIEHYRMLVLMLQQNSLP